MIVFHGSNMEIRSPNVSFSKNYLDFVCACRMRNRIALKKNDKFKKIN